MVAAASLASAVGDGSMAAASADVQDSRKTAMAAQQLVAEASKANEAEMSQDTRQGLVRFHMKRWLDAQAALGEKCTALSSGSRTMAGVISQHTKTV